jgi:hypothetical protein
VLPFIKYQAADTVATVQRAPGDKAAQLAREHRFETTAGTEKHAVTLIHHHQDRAFAFFPEEFRMGVPRSGSDTPVDGAYIIARLVVPYFLEIDAPTAEIRLVGASEGAQCPVSSSEF